MIHRLPEVFKCIRPALAGLMHGWYKVPIYSSCSDYHVEHPCIFFQVSLISYYRNYYHPSAMASAVASVVPPLRVTGVIPPVLLTFQYLAIAGGVDELNSLPQT